MSIGLLLIDPQNDFHAIPESQAPDSEASALPVTGSLQDAERLVALLAARGNSIDEVYVTLDTHQTFDVGHPEFWVDGDGNHPQPVTQITYDEIIGGVWRPVQKDLLEHALDYARALESEGRFKITVWPTHCIENSWGWQVYAPIMEELNRWSKVRNTAIHYKRKGTHPLTEHYGAFAAEYPIADAPETKLDTEFMDRLAQHDIILVAGQALSHCVGESLRQLTEQWPESLRRKIVLLSDTTSAVPGFEDYAQALVETLKRSGVQVATTSWVHSIEELAGA